MNPKRVFRSLLAAVALCGLGGTTVIATVTPATAAGAWPSAAADADALFALTNQARFAVGRAPLVWDTAAATIAQGWSRTMAARNNLSHNPNLVAEITNTVTPAWNLVGENVGFG